MSISRSAAKLIISRKRSASGVFSIKAFRFKVSSVIDGFLESGCDRNPTLSANRR